MAFHTKLADNGGRAVTEALVTLTDVGLSYRLARHGANTIKQFTIGALKRQVHFEEHRALEHVTFKVQPGEVLGVVGHNGAGKSTLLKVVARVLPPSSGRVVVRGRVAPMIELGAGFNPELTGAENVVLYGALLGREPARMRARTKDVLDWAGLESYSDVPLRAYSSGMVARLAFAVATDVEPDVLLVDEVLSVGDAAFQVRSTARMRELIQGGAAAVLVSHDMDAVRQTADRVVWMEHGRVKVLGMTEDVLTTYADARSV